MPTLSLAFSPRFVVLTLVACLTVLCVMLLGAGATPAATGLLVAGFLVFGALTLLGVHDLIQTRHAILRNYPISAHLRFMLEEIRPEMRQYFFESETDGLPFSRDPARDRLPARQDGARQAPVRHAARRLRGGLRMASPLDRAEAGRDGCDFRITVGGPDCAQPYSLSVFNISAMSFGALERQRHPRAQQRRGAAAASPTTPARAASAPIIASAAATSSGRSAAAISAAARRTAVSTRSCSPSGRGEPQIKMIEIKLSQGAKPGHGGVLPGRQSDRRDRRDPRRRARQGLRLAGAPQRLFDARSS